MKNKLNLDLNIVEKARSVAKNIAIKTQEFIDQHTTITIERTVCRLMGIDGVDEFRVPLPNIVVDNVNQANLLGKGIATFIGNAMVKLGLNPQEIAEKVASDKLDLTKIDLSDRSDIEEALKPIVKQNLQRIADNREKRKALIKKYGDKDGPYLYVIVATGNIYEDIVQAKAAARQGADVIAVIRSTGQSLLDYVPYGPTTEGYGGTYATQENFRLMRKALDEVSEDLGRYIMLTNYCSGLCMPEIAVMGAFERLDMMLNDALYGILFRDINMKRTIIDQYFSRMINAYAGVIINTGEDNYLIGLGHAFEMNPDLENGFLYELAQAQMARQIFPKSPLKYMPPTKYMTGNIFKGHVQDALFNMVTIMTNQRIHLLGMLTEAIHTPFMSDRALSIENAKYIFNNMKAISEEIMFKPGGMMEKRANEVLNKAYKLLLEIDKIGLFKTIERGIFADIKRPIDGGKGLEGVIKREPDYFNPFMDVMIKELKEEGD